MKAYSLYNLLIACGLFSACGGQRESFIDFNIESMTGEEQLDGGDSRETQSRTDRLQTLREGEALYRRYVDEHQADLKVGSYVTLLDNNYATATTFETLEEAFEYYKGHQVRYCKQYQGPGIEMDRAVVTHHSTASRTDFPGL